MGIRRLVPPAALVTLLAGTATVAAVGGDRLGAASFDKEVTLDMKAADVINVFRMLARISAVPFVLELDEDPSLKVTFKAQNLALRGVLTSLAGAYDLEYAESDEGIVVRRRDAHRAAQRITVGAWPPRPGPKYQLVLLVRDAQGKPLGSPRIITPLGIAAILKQGIGTGSVLEFDPKRSIAEPRAPMLTLQIVPKRDTDGGLELLMELVTERVLSESHHVQDHVVTSMTVGQGETVLFKTDGGYEIVLTSWVRLPSP